jgi:hypothetical protein
MRRSSRGLASIQELIRAVLPIGPGRCATLRAVVKSLTRPRGGRGGCTPLQRVEVPDLPVEPLLGRPDVPDAREELVEVVVPDGLSRLETGVVQDEALHQVLAKPLGRPPTELRASVRAYAVADGERDLEVVVVDHSPNGARPLGLNRQVLLDGSRRVELAFLEDVLDMKANVLLRRLEELCQKHLREPHGPALEADLDPALTVLTLVEHKLGRARSFSASLIRHPRFLLVGPIVRCPAACRPERMRRRHPSSAAAAVPTLPCNRSS